jgi:hypothetical protein
MKANRINVQRAADDKTDKKGRDRNNSGADHNPETLVHLSSSFPAKQPAGNASFVNASVYPSTPPCLCQVTPDGLNSEHSANTTSCSPFIVGEKSMPVNKMASPATCLWRARFPNTAGNVD